MMRNITNSLQYHRHTLQSELYIVDQALPSLFAKQIKIAFIRPNYMIPESKAFADTFGHTQVIFLDSLY